MASLVFISKSYPIYVAVWLLSWAMPAIGQTGRLDIPIHWTLDAGGTYTFEEAVYRPTNPGLPVFSIALQHGAATLPEIVHLVKKEISPAQSERIAAQFPAKGSLLQLKKMTDRGHEVAVLDILPFVYDSLANRYALVQHLVLDFAKSNQKSGKAHLRTSQEAAHSVLAQGEWFKIPVTENGIYKIDYNYLRNSGLNMEGINPRKIKLFGNGGGMLPQKNSDPRPDDLIENAIWVSGEADGKFDKNDFLLFYGQSPHHLKMNEDGEPDYRHNFYSDTTYYFITLGANDGARISTQENLGLDQPAISTFDDFLVYEKNEYNVNDSGRDWYGQRFASTNTYDFKFDFDGLVPNTMLKVTSKVLGQTYEATELELYVNGKSIGKQNINAIVEGAYLAVGSTQKDEFAINTSEVPASDKFTIRMTFRPVGTGKSEAKLDYLLVSAKRKLKLYGSQTIFRSIETLQHAMATYTIEGAGSQVQVWDISDPLKPRQQKISIVGENVAFGAFSNQLHEFIAFSDQNYMLPYPAQKIPNQDLHGLGAADLLIISHLSFISEAERLAALRRNHDGLDVEVVTVGQIYNEFSSGKQDVSAIRDFIKYVYDQGEGNDRLQNVLLFGKGTFDYKDRIDRNTNYVPIYTSRNSVHPINSYSSDDFYGFLDEDEGEWEESYLGDHLMDIGIGRLPVKTPDEASVVVDKLVRYATSPDAFGSWRNELFFIADDGDGNLHQRDADKLATLVDTAYTQFNVNKMYLDAYPQVLASLEKVSPELNADIDRNVEKGGLIFNFTGHGSTTRWTHETILNISSVLGFKNYERLPLFVTATCEFGRHDTPKLVSGAEYLLLNPDGGAIGLLTTARPVFSSTNYILNKAFYQNVFQKENGRYRTLGEVFRRTKNQSLNGSVNRNFSLLADPSMVLACAPDEVVLVAGEDVHQPGDTLHIPAKVKIKGRVLDSNGVLNGGFNGSAYATVYDRAREVTTLGDEDAPMRYMARDNLIFKGEASVADGEFSLEFIVPNNLEFHFDKAKINIYAVDASQHIDAAGSNIEYVIGGPGDELSNDTEPPKIELFINDDSFLPGGITGKDVTLMARLSDESGIRISNAMEGEELSATLDGAHQVILNAFYTSEKDTYQQGWVTYLFKDLSIGEHNIRLNAWDIHGNGSEAEIVFNVTKNRELTIDKLAGFPNPFRDFTRVGFEHNRAGDDLEISIEIYSLQGKLVHKFTTMRPHSASRINDLEWDGSSDSGGKLTSGLYFLRLFVRSLNDGSKNQANQKLVIIN
ncbi:MAG: type IX secretion system sortase PorU [Cyclobacteriaceae bacterium]|nr:type IX secretion system sortase PorU [Cyclobacteriaceae bacterium]